MTFSQFQTRFDSGERIYCRSTHERNKALLFLENHGYSLGDIHHHYLTEDPDDSPDYLCPGLTSTAEYRDVGCYYGVGKLYIDFDDIICLITGECDDETSVDETELQDTFLKVLSAS